MPFFTNKRVRIALLSIIAFTLFFTVFGKRGLIKIYKLHKEMDRIEASMVRLKVENKELANNIQSMKSEKPFQERSARETLGLVKDNEIIYEFSD